LRLGITHACHQLFKRSNARRNAGVCGKIHGSYLYSQSTGKLADVERR
jgi:hypothetical protein